VKFKPLYSEEKIFVFILNQNQSWQSLILTFLCLVLEFLEQSDLHPSSCTHFDLHSSFAYLQLFCIDIRWMELSSHRPSLCNHEVTEMSHSPTLTVLWEFMYKKLIICVPILSCSRYSFLDFIRVYFLQKILRYSSITITKGSGESRSRVPYQKLLQPILGDSKFVELLK